MSAAEIDDDVKQPVRPSLLSVLGPGLITGASDDDPSGIATYSQAGAQFGYNLSWTMVLTWPLMCAIQEISARIGRVTGRGIAGNLRLHFPRSILVILVGVLAVANIINLGADLGAMGAALNLVLPGPQLLYTAAFAFVTLGLEVMVRYSRYASILKWMTLSLFAYFGVVAFSKVPWGTAIQDMALPHIQFSSSYLTVIVAVFGTTISPYLFFWQASEEVEDLKERAGSKPLERAPEQASAEFSRIRWDTYIGMAFSNIVALAIIISTAATLHRAGITNIATSADAAKALAPIAGKYASLVFSLGVIGTGMLAVPVLAGSAAYAVGEALGVHVGLARRFTRAKTFYAVIAFAIIVGLGLNMVSIDPVKALFWSAVLNGVAAVPIMIMMMVIGSSAKTMGRFVLPSYLRIFGWAATGVMAAASVAMFATSVGT